MSAESGKAVERFDCTDGGAQFCQGCYTMTPDSDGEYVRHEDYAKLENQRAALVEALKSALSECADDLEAEVSARASDELPRRIERDLEPVRKARALLAQPAGTWVNPLAAEVEALRAALSQCATAVGASAAPDCSVEFLACVPREVELVVEKLRAASVIEWEPGRSYTAAELLRRAIRGLRVRKGRPVWPAVMNLFGVGSTVGHHLCRWAGRDPDTGQEIAARKGEGVTGA